MTDLFDPGLAKGPYRRGFEGIAHQGVGGSEDGAKQIAPVAADLRSKVLAVIEGAGAYGVTSDEVATALELPNPYSSRPRIAELRKMGRIFDSRRRRAGHSGVNVTVWVGAAHSQPVRIGDAA